MSTMHHPVRRRKRRSHGNSSSASFSGIGVRSVDVVRGSNGFGFTISGQQPCLLSCIVAGSPAECAGLRPGHALVAVNGRSVARLPHDTVVRLIGSCAGTLRLHVSENSYLESSDSDIEDVDSYLPRRPAQGRAARVVRDLQTGAMFVDKTPPRPVISPPPQLPPRGVQNPPPPPLPPSRVQPSDFRAVVGYLGTIELPKELRPGSRLAVIRSCVRRMRAEKRIHTIVNLIVRREQSVILADSLGTILAEFLAERVAFCGACADDKRFFGLVTSVTSVDDEEDGEVSAACGGSSCHVFMIDPTLHPHHAHANRATAFRLTCTPCGDGCAEFPAIADPILRAVAALYSPTPVSPPPPPPRSNTSSCPSSNSDSGIGFRDELLNSEDLNPSEQRLTVRAMPDPPLQQVKLSPKVYGLMMAQSLEDLPAAPAVPSGDESMSSLEQWGSLQDLRKPAGKRKQQQRRRVSTHHQHPSCSMMPPPPLTSALNASDEETDYEQPFKKWCSGSYFGSQYPGLSFPSTITSPLTLLPPLTPLPNKHINFSTISLTSSIISPPSPVVPSPATKGPSPPMWPTAGMHFIDQLSLSTVLSPDTVSLINEIKSEADDTVLEQTLVSASPSKRPHDQSSHSEATLDNNLEKFISKTAIPSSVIKYPSQISLHSALNNSADLENDEEYSSPISLRSVVHDSDVENEEKLLPLRSNETLLHSSTDEKSLYKSKSSSLKVTRRSSFTSRTVSNESLNSQSSISQYGSQNSLSRSSFFSVTTISSGQDSPNEYKFFTPVTTHKISEARCKSLTSLKCRSPNITPVKSQPELSKIQLTPTSFIASKIAKFSFISPRITKTKKLILDTKESSTFLRPLTPKPVSTKKCTEETKTKAQKNVLDELAPPADSEVDQSRGGAAPPSCFDSFEKLLDDPNGMHAFSEFLKKEFSHENIYFWVACEKYRRLKEVAARKAQARCIYQRHLAMGAPEPVNVDSQARQSTKDGLDEARPDLFLSAQKQIFNLMKFDSYPRFLKCDQQVREETTGQVDPELLLHTGDEPKPGKLKKSRSDAEDRRRKSLLPWHRKNTVSRSKSRDRSTSSSVAGGEGVARLDDSSSVRSCSELTGSRSSLASSDLALIQRGSTSRQSMSSSDMGSAAADLCRVILPDGATTVVPIIRGESTKQLIVRLLEKRGLHFSSFEVFKANSSKPLVVSDDSSVLAGKEVRVEQRVVFRLDLPSRKTVGVKAKAGRSLAEVLRPILHKYGYRLENTTVTLICDSEPLDPSLQITAVENQRLQVTVTGSEGTWKEKQGNTSKSPAPGVTLDEITNRVFEELLQGKTGDELNQSAHQGALSDQGSVRSEDWSSEHSSGIFGRFLRRDSAFLDKTRESRSKGKKVCSSSTSMNKHSSQQDLDSTLVSTCKAAGSVNLSKWKNTLTSHGRSESDELYEGLKRAQRSRLEDQRGTEINFELPDFLKGSTMNSHRGWL